MRSLLLLFFLCTILIVPAFAQEAEITGQVLASDKTPLPGVSVVMKKNPARGTVTDAQGMYKLSAVSGDVIVFSFIGFKTQELEVGNESTLNLGMEESMQELSELLVTGTRSVGRTEMETAVPVDVISIQDVMGSLPQIDLAQMLAILAPSFNAVRSQGGDLDSHVDPAQLRNLAPNQTLVLVNGKRRHTAALLIMSTAVGSPSTSVDLMTIPASAIERVEILRDGAAAQYGSDAVAGVINIVLKKGTNVLTGSFTGGGYLNSGGDAGELTSKGDPDGYNYQLTANYGFDIGKGFLNLSGEITQRRPTLRPFVNDWGFFDGTYLNNERTDKYGNPIITNPELIAAQAAGDEAMIESLKTQQGLMDSRGLTHEDFAVYAGMPAITLGSTFYNAELPLSPSTTLYTFGGLSYKYLQGYSCYFRRPAQTDRFNYLLYPNGFRPQMNSNSADFSNTIGIRSTAGSFNMDFSNTFGRNRMRIGMVNTMNASLGSNTPINMRLGTHQFTQNTTNLDFSRNFKEVLSGLNIAFGAEMRVENYKIIKGQEESYTTGDAGTLTVGQDGLLTGPDGKPLEDRSGNPIVDANGDPMVVERGDEVIIKGFSSNCQCFAGFGPKNERDEFRTTLAAYVDAELDITEDFLVTGAVRLENYSDFGQVLTGKVASRYSILDNLSVRGSLSSGFRAPSLQELNYTHTATVFIPDVNGVPQPVDYTTFPTNSTAARVLGIQELSEERSNSYGFGLTYQVAHKLDVSVDAYQIDVKNRIFRTDSFNAGNVGNNYEEVIGEQGEAQFFINGADVRSKGVEAVVNYTTQLSGTSTLTFNVAGIFSKNEIIKRKVADLNVANLTDEELVNKYLNRQVVGQFETGTPRTKLISFVNYEIGKFSAMIRGTYYGEVTELSTASDADGNFYDQTFSAQFITDVSLGFRVNQNIKLSVGSNNIFDKYPDVLREENQGFYLYSNNQHGSNGAYFYGRVMFNF